MEKQLSAGPGERQVAQFVQDDQVKAGERVSQASGLAVRLFLFEFVDQIQHVEKTHPGSAVNAASAVQHLNFRIKPFQLYPCGFGFELPVDFSTTIVHVLFPGGDLSLH